MLVLRRMCKVSSLDVSGVDLSVHIAASLRGMTMDGRTETVRKSVFL